MLYELKKICGELHVKILLIIILIVSIALAIIPIINFSVLDAPDSVNVLKGKEAIRVSKDQYESVKGELTIKKLNKVLKYYKSFSSADEAYINTSIKYPGASELIFDAYTQIGSEKEPDIFGLKNVNDFYDRGSTKVADTFSVFENDYEGWEKVTALEKAKSIDIPYRLDFYQQWKFVYTSITILFIVIAIAVIFMGSRIFSYEKDNNMDTVLSTLDKPSLRKIGRNKTIAMIVISLCVFYLSVLIMSVIFFSSMGLSSWNSQVQCYYFVSLNDLTFGEAYLMFVFLGWLGILAIGLITSLANSFSMKSLVSLVVGGTIFFLPFIINKLGIFPVAVNKLMQVQPLNGFSVESILESLHIYKFMSAKILTSTAMGINSMVILIICFITIPWLFSLRINKT